jgi:hypothetical protein
MILLMLLLFLLFMMFMMMAMMMNMRDKEQAKVVIKNVFTENESESIECESRFMSMYDRNIT